MDPQFAETITGSSQGRNDPGIDFDDVQRTAGFQQRRRDRASTGADFEQPLARSRRNGLHDARNRARVMEKMLTEPFSWAVAHGVGPMSLAGFDGHR